MRMKTMILALLLAAPAAAQPPAAAGAWDPAERLAAQSDYPLTVGRDGFSWSHPAGPGASIRYTATVKDGEWHEIGSASPEASRL